MVKKTYRKFSKKGLSKKNKLRKSKRKSLRSKRKSRKHGGYGQLASSGPEIKKSYLTYGHLPCDTTNKFQNFLCELAKYYYYKMNKGDKARTKEEDHKQKLIAREKERGMGIKEDKLDGLYDEVTAEVTADVTADTIKEKLYDKLVIENNLKKILGQTPYTGRRWDIWDARKKMDFSG